MGKKKSIFFPPDFTPSKFPFNAQLICCLRKSERAKWSPGHHKHRSTDESSSYHTNACPQAHGRHSSMASRCGFDVIWDNKDQRAIKDHNPQQIVIIQTSPGGRRRLFRSWLPWCSGILFSLEISELSSFGSCPTQLHSYVDTKELYEQDVHF